MNRQNSLDPIPDGDVHVPIRDKQTTCFDGLKTKWEEVRHSISPRVLLLVFALCVVGTANRVAFKVMTNSTAFRVDSKGDRVVYYTTFISQFTTFVFIPVFWSIIWFLMLFTDRITPEMRAFSIWKYVAMGFLDSFAGILMVCGGARTAGPLQQLIGQSSIPFVMFATYLCSRPFATRWFGLKLNASYRPSHYVGAILILVGVLVAVVPQMSVKDSETMPAYVVMLLAATVPLVFGTIYKEIVMKGSNLDVFLVTGWVSLFQFFFGFLLLPLSALPEDDPLKAISNLPHEFWNGILCFFGYNTLGSDFPNLCMERLVWLHILIYTTINFFYNILFIKIIQVASASILQISSALQLPMADICFSIPFIMNEFPPLPPASYGEEATTTTIPFLRPLTKILSFLSTNYDDYTSTLSPYGIVALLIILVGLGIYIACPETKPDDYSSLIIIPINKELDESSPLL